MCNAHSSPRYSLVVDKDVKKLTKQTNKDMHTGSLALANVALSGTKARYWNIFDFPWLLDPNNPIFALNRYIINNHWQWTFKNLFS